MPAPSERLSICMVTTFYPPYSFGGDAMHVYWLANELARGGHRVTVVHSVDAYRALSGKQPANGLPPHEPGVTVHAVSSRFGRLSVLATYVGGRPGRRLAATLEEPFDVVHFHNPSLIGGPGALGRGSGVKLYSMHEYWLVCPMHMLWRDNREPCVDAHCLRCTLIHRRPPQLWRYGGLLERSLDNIDVFLSPSRFAIEAHRERGFTRPVRWLPNFAPAAEPGPRPQERPYFLFAGRLVPFKGAGSLLEPFRGYPADLLVAGDGPEASALRRRAAGLDNVRFLGRVDPAELPAYYAGAIATIVPTAGFDIAPLVVLESLAQGTPVIVHDLGGLPEAVHDCGGGLVYRTPEELVAAMDALRLDPALRGELGERARTGWREHWTPERHVERYLEAVEDGRALAAR